MNSDHIEILWNALSGEETVSVDLTVGPEDLVFVVGPRAERLEPGLYARKTLHRLAESRYLADQTPNQLLRLTRVIAVEGWRAYQ